MADTFDADKQSMSKVPLYLHYRTNKVPLYLHYELNKVPLYLH